MTLSKLKAERDKARAEAAKATHDDSALVRGLALFAPFLTVAVAAFGIVVTVKRNLADREAERTARAGAEDKDRTARADAEDFRFRP